MPIYNIKNNETGETSELMMSYDVMIEVTADGRLSNVMTATSIQSVMSLLKKDTCR